jgi:hypothetical protein
VGRRASPPSSFPLLHRRERGRLEDLVGDVGEDWAVRLGFGAFLQPFGVVHEGGPFGFALGQGFPGQEVDELLVALADDRRPEAGLADAEALPDLERDRLEAVEEGRELALLRWGLIPAWAKDPAIGNRMINARVETVAEKPSFRRAFKERRCLIPADGFYEWQKTNGGKQPYHLKMRDGRPFAFAGLWVCSFWVLGLYPEAQFFDQINQ